MVTARRKTSSIACALVIASLVAGCATSDSSGQPKSELDKAIGRCVVSVGVGAVLGAIAGNNSGRGNAGRGAVIGAAAGGVICAVMLKVAKDKDAILARQQAAVAQGVSQRTSFQGKEGQVEVATRVRDAAPMPAKGDAPPRVCRYADSTVTVSSGQAALAPQLYCRTDAGDWTIA